MDENKRFCGVKDARSVQLVAIGLHEHCTGTVDYMYHGAKNASAIGLHEHFTGTDDNIYHGVKNAR